VSSLTTRLAKTDARIQELTQQIDLCHKRIARRSRNPALAEQAHQLLLARRAELAELMRHRKRIIRALEIVASLSPHAESMPRRSPVIPRYLR
jgi:hypothetical protein